MFFKPAGRGNHLPGGSYDVLLLDVAQATNGSGVGRDYDSTYHLSADPIDRDLLKGLEKLQLDFSPSGTYEAIAAAMFGEGVYPSSSNRSAFRFAQPFVNFLASRTDRTVPISVQMSLEDVSSRIEAARVAVTVRSLLNDRASPLWAFSGDLRDALTVLARRSFGSVINLAPATTLHELFRVVQSGESVIMAADNSVEPLPAEIWSWWS
jgi:hypothetical protein